MLKRQWSRTMGNLRTIFWLMVSALALASCVDVRLQPEADKPKSGLLVLKGATIYAQPDQAPLENGAIVLEGRQSVRSAIRKRLKFPMAHASSNCREKPFCRGSGTAMFTLSDRSGIRPSQCRPKRLTSF